MKISLLGNCQTEPIAACIAVMRPNDDVHSLFGAANLAEGSDIVFAQQGVWTDEQIAGYVKNEEVKILPFPRFYFSGFHPDVIMQDLGGQMLTSAAGVYNSSIILFSYLKGIEQQKIPTFFRADVYQHLGFFDHWQQSRTAMIEEMNSCGIDGATLFNEWEDMGCFAFTPNHPKIGVAASIARSILKIAGLPAAVQYPESFLDDPLEMHGAWPVHPELAQRLKILPSSEFKFRSIAGRYRKGFYGLPEFIEKSFEFYRRQEFDLNSISRFVSMGHRYNQLTSDDGIAASASVATGMAMMPNASLGHEVKHAFKVVCDEDLLLDDFDD